MVHDGQRLPLGFESGNYLPCVHARLEDFQCDFSPYRFGLFGQKDDAKAAFANLFK